MNDNKIMKEKISALADGELSDFETRRILSELSSNSEYREFWRNIHKAKEALKDDKEIFLDVDISSKVSSSLNKIRSQPSRQTKELDYTQVSYLTASFVGFCAVMVYSLYLTSTDSFSRKILPFSVSITPEMFFIKVVLPAPLAPKTETIEPFLTSKETPFRAIIGP